MNAPQSTLGRRRNIHRGAYVLQPCNREVLGRRDPPVSVFDSAQNMARA
jgi:hypothetical protein